MDDSSQQLRQPTQLWEKSLRRIDEQGLYPNWRRVAGEIAGPSPIINSRRFLSFASNNYLGLSQDPRVIAGAIKAAEQYGIGPGHSRVIGGTPVIVEELERELAAWTGFEACLIFPTGYMANIGIIQALLTPLFGGTTDRAAAFVDQYVHGSLLDGCRLAGCRVIPFRHNQIDDLRRKLRRFDARHKLIITEGVFTLEGSVIDAGAYVAVAREAGAMLMVDDAHGLGLVGAGGAGTHTLSSGSCGMDIYMASMDKAMGATGGLICGSAELIRYLRVASRSAILSSCFPAMTAGAVLKATEIIKTMDEKRSLIYGRAACLRQRLRQASFRVLGDLNHPSIAVLIGKDEDGIAAERKLFELGLLQPIVRWPAVPRNASRFRLNVSTLHSEEDLDTLIRMLANCSLPRA